MPEGEEGFEFVQTANPDDSDVIDSLLDGTPRSDTWVPIHMRVITKGERRRSLQRSDAPSPMVGNFLVLRQGAANALAPFLEKHGELMPLACEEAELVVFNPLCVVDALDEAASDIQRFDDGRIMWIDKYAFHKDLVREQRVFKITSLQPSPIFVGEEFVERWRHAGLQGLEFRQVWEG